MSTVFIHKETSRWQSRIGGERNWDYRFTWVRDAAFTVYSMMRLGYTEEAAAFAEFIQQRAGLKKLGLAASQTRSEDGMPESVAVLASTMVPAGMRIPARSTSSAACRMVPKMIGR